MTVQTGLARLIDEGTDVVAGRRVGLVCNPTSVDAELRHAIDLLRPLGLVALFGPEHGVRGDAQDMIGVDHDAQSGLPVHSLYGHTAESLSPTPAMLEDGRGLYTTYCLVCHGAAGKGDGPLVVAGKIPTPPAYTSERVAAFPPGRIFHVVTMGTQDATGKQKMPSYAALLTPGERWKVVGYVAAKLQRSATP